MKSIVDSCGWLEYFSDSGKAALYAPLIEKTENLIVPSLCIYEVFKRVFTQRGEDAALQAIALMHQGMVVPCDEAIALYGAKLSIDHKLPMADALILATARSKNATLWTQDSDLKGIEGVQFVE